MTRRDLVVVVGSCIADITVRVPHIPKIGQTVTGISISRSLGGKGANQAVALARLGVRTSLIASIGNDDLGREFLRLLDEEGVGRTHVSSDPHLPTGVGIPMVTGTGENAIVVVPSAAMGLPKENVLRARSLITTSSALLLQFEAPPDALQAAMSCARERGVPIYLNPAPITEDSRKLVQLADVVIMNEEEAGWITGKGTSSIERVGVTARAVQSMGPAVAVVTLGKEGAVLSTADFSVHVPGYTVASVDATGAGDAFCAGIVLSRLAGRGWADAVSFANACGALATTSVGTIPSLPRLGEVENFVRSRAPLQPVLLSGEW